MCAYAYKTYNNNNMLYESKIDLGEIIDITLWI